MMSLPKMYELNIPKKQHQANQRCDFLQNILYLSITDISDISQGKTEKLPQFEEN